MEGPPEHPQKVSIYGTPCVSAGYFSWVSSNVSLSGTAPEFINFFALEYWTSFSSFWNVRFPHKQSQNHVSPGRIMTQDSTQQVVVEWFSYR